MADPFGGILFIHENQYILILATTWMNLGNIMLSGISLSKKTVLYYFIDMSRRRGKFIEKETR